MKETIIFPSKTSINFNIPPNLEASEPPEERGLTRDQVKLMVTYLNSGRIVHTQFFNLPDFLNPGDLLVINTSETLNAAIHVQRENGMALELHLSTHLPADLWSIELRIPGTNGTLPYYDAQRGERLEMPDGGYVILLTPYRSDQRDQQTGSKLPRRLWIAEVHFPAPYLDYLEAHGFPIRYKYLHGSWPNRFYQTVYATEPGSAEMPSAGRSFTPELITRLIAQGVQIAPLVLHTGVASLEEHEPPYDEFYRVPIETAEQVNHAHATGKRVIAVGTTVVRALETVTGADRVTRPGEGWTDLVISPQRGLFACDGLLTGWHEPRSSHLWMLETLTGPVFLRNIYQKAIERQYLWHEFGDLNLILPGK